MIKKGLVCVLALCMLCSAAFAAIQDGPLAVLEGNEWSLLTKADLLVKETDGKQFVYDLQMNQIGEGYDEVHDYKYSGLVVEAEQDGIKLKGVINPDGTLRIPVQYADAVCEGEYVNVETTDGGVIAFGPDGTQLENVPDSIYDFSYIPDNYRALTVDYQFDDETERYALTDKDGKLLTDYLFDSIRIFDFYTEDYCSIGSSDDKEGLLAMDGTIVIPAEYDEVLNIDHGPYETCGIFAAMRDDAVAFVKDGAVTEIPVENVDFVDFYGTCVVIEYEDDTYAIARPDGTLQKLEVEDLEVYMVGDAVYFKTEEENAETDEEEEVLYDEAFNELLRTEGRIEFNVNGFAMVKDYEGTCTLYSLK